MTIKRSKARKNVPPQDILEFINNFKKEKKRVPIQVEIAREFDVSRQIIRYHLNKLKPQLLKYPEYQRYFKDEPTETGIN